MADSERISEVEMVERLRVKIGYKPGKRELAEIITLLTDLAPLELRDRILAQPATVYVPDDNSVA